MQGLTNVSSSTVVFTVISTACAAVMFFRLWGARTLFACKLKNSPFKKVQEVGADARLPSPTHCHDCM
jgi:hypothetical protein